MFSYKVDHHHSSSSSLFPPLTSHSQDVGSDACLAHYLSHEHLTAAQNDHFVNTATFEQQKDTPSSKSAAGLDDDGKNDKNTTKAKKNKNKERDTSSSSTSSSPLPQKRSSGKKDRHSKIRTAKGLRDRRIRLSVQVSREFFDLQDMLGFDKASNTIDWLISKSRSSIMEARRQRVNNDDDGLAPIAIERDSREKATERARERTREKLSMKAREIPNPNDTRGHLSGSSAGHDEQHHHCPSDLRALHDIIGLQQVMDDDEDDGEERSMSIIKRFLGITSTDATSSSRSSSHPELQCGADYSDHFNNFPGNDVASDEIDLCPVGGTDSLADIFQELDRNFPFSAPQEENPNSAFRLHLAN